MFGCLLVCWTCVFWKAVAGTFLAVVAIVIFVLKDKWNVRGEAYWNGKYPKTVVKYTGRSLPNHGMMDVDVRVFCGNANDADLHNVVDPLVNPLMSDDDKALLCLCWVIDHVAYVSDKSLFGLDEYWAFPWETLHTMKGDCDDGAILLENLMRAAGVPYWKVRLTAGLVPDGGHAYVTYYCERKGHWVALDWCYHPNRKPIVDRPDYKYDPIYVSVWFSWNQRYAFAKDAKTGVVYP